MTASIRETIIDSLPGAAASSQYVSYVNDVESALTEREYQFSEAIASEVSQRFGVSVTLVNERLAALGMALRPAPEPEPVVEEPAIEAFEAQFTEESTEEEVSEAPADLAKAVKKLAKRIKKLEKVAKRAEEHGYV